MTNLETILQKVLQELNLSSDLNEQNITEKLKNSVQNLERNESKSFDQDSKRALRAFFYICSSTKNFDPNYKFEPNGNSLLHLAARFGCENVLNAL